MIQILETIPPPPNRLPDLDLVAYGCQRACQVHNVQQLARILLTGLPHKADNIFLQLHARVGFWNSSQFQYLGLTMLFHTYLLHLILNNSCLAHGHAPIAALMACPPGLR
jgi:hypothetical protein